MCRCLGCVCKRQLNPHHLNLNPDDNNNKPNNNNSSRCCCSGLEPKDRVYLQCCDCCRTPKMPWSEWKTNSCQFSTFFLPFLPPALAQLNWCWCRPWSPQILAAIL